MIVVDRPKLKFLLAGRIIEVDVRREYRKGRSYALGLSHKRSVCQVQVLASRPTEDGFRLTIKRMSGDEVRLFTRGGVYVSAPIEANPDDPDVLRGADFHEPEPLTEKQLRDLTAYRAARAHNERTAPLVDLRDKMIAELDEALRTSPSRDERDKLRAARHHLRRIA